MKIVLLSDIHANLPALRAVLSDIDARGDADTVHHLGDLVGYAPRPDEVVETLAQPRGGHTASPAVRAGDTPPPHTPLPGVLPRRQFH
ncbi:MAG: metallophosphoesterase family protein [Longimicrobiales bacterium]|nr:metallophosphoesterase family protein [Longimicrobiales bacterium]